jgi:hypothetical protein
MMSLWCSEIDPFKMAKHSSYDWEGINGNNQNILDSDDGYDFDRC